MKKDEVEIPEKIADTVEDAAGDGVLSDEDVEELSDAVRSYNEKVPLEDKQFDAIRKRVSDVLDENADSRTPLWLKVVSVAALVIAAVNIPNLFFLAYDLFEQISSGAFSNLSYLTWALGTVFTMAVSIDFIVAILVCIMILRSKRRQAAIYIYINMLVAFAALVSGLMLYGFIWQHLIPVAQFALLVVLQSYLDPSMSRERKLKSEFRNIETESRAKRGTLGLDTEGKGYIKLDYFNIFWIFIVGSVVGIIAEVLCHYFVVVPGEWEFRFGLLFLPVAPIYGLGAVLMTMILNRFKNANVILIFVACTIIGAVFEYCGSWFCEIVFGMEAWDYHDEFLNIGGRTCLWFSCAFGLMGTVWIKLALPAVLKLINKIPWQARYVLTAICSVLLFTDVFMTFQAWDCWFNRLAGMPPTTDVELFYAKYFNDDVMHARFPGITLHPELVSHP